MQLPRRVFLSVLCALTVSAALPAANAADAPDAAAPNAAPPNLGPTVKVDLKTNMGDIVLELYPEKAPKTVDNFLKYVKEGFYSGTIFHRVIDGFMIQAAATTRNWRRNRCTLRFKTKPRTASRTRRIRSQWHGQGIRIQQHRNFSSTSTTMKHSTTHRVMVGVIAYSGKSLAEPKSWTRSKC